MLSALLCSLLSAKQAYSGKTLIYWKNLIVCSVDEDIEIRGLDIKKHGEPAYPTAAYGHGWDAEGDFRMSSKWTNNSSTASLISDLNTGTQQGRRDIRALANPNDPNAWSNQVSEGGLIAMALGYQKQYYKGPVDGETNEAFETKE